MSRIRYLKPEFFEDEHLAELPFWVRLLFAGLWNIADKAGRLEDRPKKIKIKIFPYDKVDINKGLLLLSQTKKDSTRPFIYRYTVNNEEYIQIVNWSKHQKPHHTEKDSNIPPYPPNTMGMVNGEGECSSSKYDVKDPLPNGYLTVKDKKANKTGGEIPYQEIIDHLNNKIGTSYKPGAKDTQSKIKARWVEGYRLEDFKSVIDGRARVWLKDPKMADYLRPPTLFGTKFESYLNASKRKLTPEEEVAEWNKKYGG